jgi:hypothetical protein
VRGGLLCANYGASVVVVTAVLHLIRVVFFGSYRKPRELNWIVGLILLQLILAFGLTGYPAVGSGAAGRPSSRQHLSSRRRGRVVASLLGRTRRRRATLTRWYSSRAVLPR